MSLVLPPDNKLMLHWRVESITEFIPRICPNKASRRKLLLRVINPRWPRANGDTRTSAALLLCPQRATLRKFAKEALTQAWQILLSHNFEVFTKHRLM